MLQTYFEFFNLPQQFDLDTKKLEKNYRKIQSESHPDRFVNASSAEKLASMQMATLANEAYQTLKFPATRAKYLLELQGVDVLSENNTVMPVDFLMQQLSWREAIEVAQNASDINALIGVQNELRTESKALQASIIDALDIKKDIVSATDLTRKIVFIEKVCADISYVIEQLDT